MPFQTNIYYQPAAGVEGDFASANPYSSYVSGEGQLIAGKEGTIVGRFAWVTDGTTANALEGDPRAPDGFVHREGQAKIVPYLAEASMIVPEGDFITLMTSGDYFVRTSNACEPRDAIFASVTDGTVQCGKPGSTIEGYVETKFTVQQAAQADEITIMTSWS